MKSTGRIFVCMTMAIFSACASSSSRHASGSGPVQKVVQLLGDLEQKIIKNGDAEQKAFGAYSDWCKTGAQEKGFEIKTAMSEIEDLTATIGQAASDIETSVSKIEDLGAAIARSASDLSEASGIREKEHTEFTATEAELVDAAGLSLHDQKTLTALVQGSSDDADSDDDSEL